MFRTTFVDPTFYDNVLKVKERGLLFYEQPSRILGLSPASTDQREYFQYLESFLRLIEPIIQDLKVKGFIK